MKAAVVFESMFGNTRTIAQAIRDGLSQHLEVDLIEVSDAPASIDEGIDLLVVGGPTHAFGMTRSSTREQAAEQAKDGLVSRGIGIREWLETVQLGRPIAAAAFDTRIEKPRLIWRMGTAAKAADRQLKDLGAKIVAPPEGFLVTDSPGPLTEGESARALAWGEHLGALVGRAAPSLST